MKKSGPIKLTIMATGALAAGGCTEEPRKPNTSRLYVETYNDLDHCKSGGTFDDATCQSLYDEAKAIHNTASIRFDSPALCEEEFKTHTCDKISGEDGVSHWTPPMAGFLARKNNDDSYFQSPIYMGPDGEPYTWSGDKVAWDQDSSGNYRDYVSRSMLNREPEEAETNGHYSVVVFGGFGRKSSSGSSSRRRSLGG